MDPRGQNRAVDNKEKEWPDSFYSPRNTTGQSSGLDVVPLSGVRESTVKTWIVISWTPRFVKMYLF